MLAVATIMNMGIIRTSLIIMLLLRMLTMLSVMISLTTWTMLIYILRVFVNLTMLIVPISYHDAEHANSDIIVGMMSF